MALTTRSDLLANQSPLIDGSGAVTQDLSESMDTVLQDYLEQFSPGGQPMQLFAHAGSYMEEGTSSKPLHINTDVHPAYNTSPNPSVHSDFDNQEVLLPPHDLPEPRRRESRHTFSGMDDAAVNFRSEYGGMYNVAKNSRAISVPLSTSPSQPLEVEDDLSSLESLASYEDPAPRRRRVPSRKNSRPISTSGPIAKPVVTSSSMKRASQARRVHAGSFKCNICGDTFTTNFSRKRQCFILLFCSSLL
jgi:hypothetical protein